MTRQSILRDERAAATVEMALILPLFITLVLGVFLCGIYLQNYNAVRSVSADVSREVAISYQRENRLNETQIEAIARGVAVKAPYLLDTERLTVDAPPLTSTRVVGATEFTLTMTYNMANLIPFIPIDAFAISYTRPLFVFGPAPVPAPSPTPTAA